MAEISYVQTPNAKIFKWNATEGPMRPDNEASKSLVIGKQNKFQSKFLIKIIEVVFVM